MKNLNKFICGIVAITICHQIAGTGLAQAYTRNQLVHDTEQLLIQSKQGTLTSAKVEAIYDRYADKLIDQLDRYLNNPDLDIDKRWSAAVVLGQLGNKPATTRLRNALRNKVFLVRMAAIKGLEIVHDASVLDDLHSALRDRAMVVRAAAADALAVYAHRTSLPFLAKELMQERNFYRGKSLWVRKHIIHAIGNIGGAESLPSLIACLQEKEAVIVDVALNALNPTSHGQRNSHPDQTARRWIEWWQNNKHPSPLITSRE